MKKPALRFKGFDGEWVESNVEKECDVLTGFPFPGSEILENGIYPLLRGINITEGKIRHSQEIDRFYSGNVQGLNQYRLNVNDLVIGMDGSKVGRNSAIITERDKDSLLVQRIARLRNYEGKESIRYISILINSSYFTTYVDSLKTSSAIPHISPKDIKNFSFSISPNKTEQKAIGSFFTELDSLIEGKRVKLNKLKKLKLAYLGKMFPKKGSRVPEVRFKGFSGEWDEAKFSDVVLIERGGSPRPIEAFITSDSDGLNWVKIGDAPKLGRYITKTAEKIKPSGLSKTRTVQPGDLILSNSMSFGRPYIMAIDGCIHDGWLLIRNSHGCFDLKFLCQMLGTNNMMNQYKMFAAGSTVNNLNKDVVGKAVVSFPCIEEQSKIGNFFDYFDNLIGLQQQELDKLANIKSACLSKMFA